MYHYALTVRRTELPVWIKHYDDFLERFRSIYPRADCQEHYESTSGLHFHAIIYSPTRIYINKIHPGKGWNIDFKPVKNVKRWKAYITKEAHLETNLINEEYRLLSEYEDGSVWLPVKREEPEPLGGALPLGLLPPSPKRRMSTHYDGDGLCLPNQGYPALDIRTTTSSPIKV